MSATTKKRNAPAGRAARATGEGMESRPAPTSVATARPKVNTNTHHITGGPLARAIWQGGGLAERMRGKGRGGRR